MLFRMIQLSENAKRLSEAYKNSRNYIPWNALYGLRNRIVHDYGNVDLSVVYETLKNDIPELLEMIEKIDELKDGITSVSVDSLTFSSSEVQRIYLYYSINN